MLTDYTFLLTEFVIYITWNSSKFRSWNWLVKNLSFFANPLVFEKTWNNSNFQSSNILLRNFILFANRFGVWYNLNYLRFRAWLACLKNSTLPRERIPDMKLLVIFQNFKAPKASIQNYTFSLTDLTFLLTDSVIYITWNNSNFQSSNILLRNIILFANRFGVGYSLNYLRFRAWLACVKNSTIPLTDSF